MHRRDTIAAGRDETKGLIALTMYTEDTKELVGITIGDLLDAQAAKYPEQDCVVYPHGKKDRWSYREFADRTDALARGFMALGVRPGDKVSIWATNVPEWLLTQFSTAKMGGVLVTVNTNYKQFELEYLLRQSDTTTLVLIDGYRDSNYVQHVRALVPELEESEPGKLVSKRLPFLKNVIYVGDRENTPGGMFHFDDLYALAEGVSDAELAARKASLDPDDVINMQYTSGTTGFPKGVQLTHYNLVNNGKCIGDCMKLSTADRFCITVPLFHCFGVVLSVMASVTHGASMIMVEAFHPIRVMEAVMWENCTGLNGVPTMFIAMLENERFSEFRFDRLRTGIMAGSPCPTQVMRRVVDEMNMSQITIVFGQTESSPGMTQTTVDDPLELRVSTVGRLLPYCEGKIIDPESGVECPPNVPGEICTRGYHIMKGYYKMPEATAAAIDEEGWLHTGDIGTVDENGYYKITGRLKDMIIRGGENIYPREIEEYLYTHPAVSDVQVIGVPDKKYGEEVLAYVILKEGCEAGEQELVQFVREGLSRYKSPRYVRFIDEYPMTASGKIQKYILRERAVQELGLGDAAEIETA